MKELQQQKLKQINAVILKYVTLINPTFNVTWLLFLVQFKYSAPPLVAVWSYDWFRITE